MKIDGDDKYDDDGDDCADDGYSNNDNDSDDDSNIVMKRNYLTLHMNHVF
jgi:hypothetical protein